MLQGHTKKIKETLDKVANDFIYIGFLLWEVKFYDYYKEYGYKNVVEYAQKELNFKKAATYNFISVCEKFSRKTASGFPTMNLDDKYSKFNFTQLCEVLPLSPSQLDTITPDMSKQEIREKKKELKSKDENVITVEFKQDQEALVNNQTVIDVPEEEVKTLFDKVQQVDPVTKEQIIKFLENRLIILKDIAKCNKQTKNDMYYQCLGGINEIDLLKDALEFDFKDKHDGHSLI